MSDHFLVKTQLGTIEIDEGLIGKIVAEAVETFHGKLFLSNSRGRILSKQNPFSRNDEGAGAIEMNFGKSGIDIRIFVVVKFGISIGHITEALIEKVKKDLKEILSEEPHSIAIVVTGSISKKIAKRNIEITMKNEDYNH